MKFYKFATIPLLCQMAVGATPHSITILSSETNLLSNLDIKQTITNLDEFTKSTLGEQTNSVSNSLQLPVPNVWNKPTMSLVVAIEGYFNDLDFNDLNFEKSKFLVAPNAVGTAKEIYSNMEEVAVDQGSRYESEVAALSKLMENPEDKHHLLLLTSLSKLDSEKAAEGARVFEGLIKEGMEGLERRGVKGVIQVWLGGEEPQTQTRSLVEEVSTSSNNSNSNSTITMDSMSERLMGLWLAFGLGAVLLTVVLMLACLDPNMDSMLLANFKADTGEGVKFD